MKYLIVLIFMAHSTLGISQLSKLPLVTSSEIRDSIVEISHYYKKDTTWFLNNATTEHYHFDGKGRLRLIDVGSLHYTFKYKKGCPKSVFLTHDSKNATNSKRIFTVNKMGLIVYVDHYDRSKNKWNLRGRERIVYDNLQRIDSFEFVVDNPSSLHHGGVHTATYGYDAQGRLHTETWNSKKTEHSYTTENGFRTISRRAIAAAGEVRKSTGDPPGRSRKVFLVFDSPVNVAAQSQFPRAANRRVLQLHLF